jgi:hypothetical protein
MMDKWMEPIIKKYTNVSNPPFTFNHKTHARKATVAEKIGVEGREDIYRMFYLGGLIRTLEHEIAPSGNNELEEQKSRAHNKIKEYNEFLHANYKVVAHPIKNLVGMSLGSLLYSAEYAKSRSP